MLWISCFFGCADIRCCQTYKPNEISTTSPTTHPKISSPLCMDWLLKVLKVMMLTFTGWWFQTLWKYESIGMTISTVWKKVIIIHVPVTTNQSKSHIKPNGKPPFSCGFPMVFLWFGTRNIRNQQEPPQPWWAAQPLAASVQFFDHHVLPLRRIWRYQLGII